MKNYASVIMPHMRHDAPEEMKSVPIKNGAYAPCLSGKEKIIHMIMRRSRHDALEEKNYAPIDI